LALFTDCILPLTITFHYLFPQPVTAAAMQALFTSQPNAPLVIVGQSDMEDHAIDNPTLVPRELSF
jgi:hypothetical protein